MNNPWDTGKAIDTEAKYVAWIRGALRKAWTRYPTQNEFKNVHKVVAQVYDEEGNPVYYKTGKKAGQPKTRYECPCDWCGEVFPASKVQVDHVESAGATPNVEALTEWMLRLFCGQDNLQLLCTETCHPIKTHMDKTGLSYEEAVIDKKVIAFKKLKATEQINKLRELALPAGKNAKERSEIYRRNLS